MTNQTINSTQGKAQLDDFFTSTIVGLPQEVVLGQRFKERNLINQQYVTVDAMNAKAWLSEPAYQVLNKALKRSQRSTGVSFKQQLANQFVSHERSSALMFMLGFLASALIGLALTYAWSRTWIQFTIFN